MNDFRTLVLAPNVVKIISAADFNEKKEKGFAFLWDTWTIWNGKKFSS